MRSLWLNYIILLNQTGLRVALVGRFRLFTIIDSHVHFILNIYTRENAFRVGVHDAFKFILKLLVLADKLNFDDEGERAAFLPL